MKRIVMTTLVAVAFSCPVFATTITDISNQRKEIKARYDDRRNSENQSYDSRVAEIKQKFQNDPNKLQEELRELQNRHSKKLDDLNTNEKLDLQTIDAKRPE